MSTSRRNFLKLSAWAGGFAAAGLSFLPQSLQAGAGKLGLPYYKPGAPFADDLQTGNGTPMTLQGTVYRHDGKTPLANAVVEIWHCNAEGYFDYSQQFRNRGKVLTDKHGRYTVKTSFPGKHSQNGQAQMPQIFVLVSGEGHQPSFTRLYFDSSQHPFLNHKDWASCPMAGRPTLPKKIQKNDQIFILYHHYLFASSFLHVPSPAETAANRIRVFPADRPGHSYISLGSLNAGQVTIKLLDKKGKVVQRSFFKSLSGAQLLALDHSHLPAAVYTCSIFSARFGEVQKRMIVG